MTVWFKGKIYFYLGLPQNFSISWDFCIAIKYDKIIAWQRPFLKTSNNFIPTTSFWINNITITDLRLFVVVRVSVFVCFCVFVKIQYTQIDIYRFIVIDDIHFFDDYEDGSRTLRWWLWSQDLWVNDLL